jgi:hypothetical protein
MSFPGKVSAILTDKIKTPHKGPAPLCRFHAYGFLKTDDLETTRASYPSSSLYLVADVSAPVVCVAVHSSRCGRRSMRARPQGRGLKEHLKESTKRYLLGQLRHVLAGVPRRLPKTIKPQVIPYIGSRYR